MRIKHFFCFTAILMIISCNLTNEQKAERLISDCIKDNITYPESYETISTQIDSSSVNVSKIYEIIELSEKCTELYNKIETLERRIKSAQSTMEIYSPKEYSSEHSRGSYNRAKAEKGEYELEIQQLSPKLEEKVLALRNSINDLYDNDINGWVVTHRFRCKNDNGVQMPPQEMVFFCDLNFEGCQGLKTEYLESLFKIIEYVNESETDEILLKNLQRIIFKLKFL